MELNVRDTVTGETWTFAHSGDAERLEDFLADKFLRPEELSWTLTAE